jgi:uncharacterized membrane protein YjjP (DUF1212 family)
MNAPDAPQHQPRFSGTHRLETAEAKDILNLISVTAKLLFENGQSTQKTVSVAEHLAERIGVRATLSPSWDNLSLRLEDDPGSRSEIVPASPTSVDMNKVVATMRVIDQVCSGRMNAAAARSTLESISNFPPVSIARFAVMAGAGAAALGIIFGATHWLSLVIIAFSAGIGACLRRWLAGKSRNLFVQPFCAALLAGIIGAVCFRSQLSSILRLVAVCPCMVLVPGPHILNGGIDLSRGRIMLGSARIVYSSLVIAMICAGLLMGFALGGVSLPATGPAHTLPIAYDVIAAAVAVAAYGTFFQMPWRMLPIPILIGMLAHACRLVAISHAHTNVATGAFVACLLVGILMTPITNRLRLPFAGFAFASVVSLIPGVYLFRMAGGMVELITLGTKMPQDLFIQVLTDGTTALLTILAMTFGLIVPKLCIEHYSRPVTAACRV